MMPFCNIECRFSKNSPTFNISHNTLIINILQQQKNKKTF